MGDGKHSTNYIKEKWEKELEIEITEEDWISMWRTHHSSTNSRVWREFAWKNQSRYFITPKIMSRQIKKQMGCWRECGEVNADHSHIFWKCNKIQKYWEMVKDRLQQILGYEVLFSSKVLYLGDLEGGNVQDEDRYLVQILLVTGKKAITRMWGQVEVPEYEQWTAIVEEIHVMERLTHKLRLKEKLMDRRWGKWLRYRDSNGNMD